MLLLVAAWHPVGSVSGRVALFDWINSSQRQHRPVTFECGQTLHGDDTKAGNHRGDAAQTGAWIPSNKGTTVWAIFV